MDACNTDNDRMNSSLLSPNRLSLIREEPTATQEPNLKPIHAAVLRPGESMETFFQLNETTHPEYELLCRRLVAAPSPRLWNQVLRSTPATGTSLRRLYRRATFLYALDDAQQQTKEVLDVWLSYAKIQPPAEASRTLQFIGIHSWTQTFAAYYLCCAKLEPNKASEHLHRGLEASAEPRVELETAMSLLLDDDTQRASAVRWRPNDSPTPLSKQEEKLHRTPTVRSHSSMNKENRIGSMDKTSETRLASQKEPTPTRKNLSFGSNSKSNPSKLDLASSKTTRSRLDQEVLKHTTPRHPDHDRLASKNSKKPPLATKRDPESTTKKHASKPDTSEDLSYILKWEPSLKNVDSNRKRPRNDEDTATPRPPRISKKDLDYMFSWNPTERNSCTKEATGSSNGSQASSKEEGSVDHAPGSSDTGERQTVRQQEVDAKQSLETTIERPRQSISGIHEDFLHLVRSDNIIRVNNVPYMKLDVIGKGGSCKVYRVMTTNGSIRALKKVKLNGVAADSIEGYTNEIALLKKLSNNPAIIHLYDSEVVPRKVIHFIMEVGEVDLNHVLQKKQSQDGGLNINFVRLTWMQMLKAVHSIHEERIIHGKRLGRGMRHLIRLRLGDLKPANFLFVRGSLKLIDFGIAKSIESDDTINVYRDNTVGTCNYMSPESLFASGSDPNEQKLRCGRMIYGRTPFSAIYDVRQKAMAIANPFHQIKYPPADQAAIESMQSCLDRDPEKRMPIVGPDGLLEHRFLNSGSFTR